MTSPYLRFGPPPDAVAVAALVAAFGLFFLHHTRLGERVRQSNSSLFIAVLAGLAAALSAGYVVHYLRGGPRIIDATSYWLEARALAAGKLAFDVPDPTGSFRGRFLVSPTEAGSPLAVIFPPGYPALLALGFLLRSPLSVGPLLAAGLVGSTYWLARELVRREDVARLAAALSLVCAALRYHTADTMSHGLSALLFSVSLAAAARGGPALVAGGLSLGWLCATRPLTGAVAVAVCLWVALRHRWRAGWLLPGMIPGIALLLAHQHAATGSYLGSSQLRYYALADGPPGCFGWGFGAGVGCVYEHGEYVRARLVDGYGALEALLNTLRRLWVHSIDIANFEPWALLVPATVVRYRKSPGVAPLGTAVIATMLAYSGFYFDGSYPGGGARLFADVLPFEHVLLAYGLIELGAARWALPAALAGFAVHAVFGHLALRDREGARPMFESAALAQAGITRGLVFVGTDHGFALGHDPSGVDPWQSVLVARRRGDAHDLLLWERFGRPPAYEYRFDPGAPRSEARLFDYPLVEQPTLRFEVEAEWPPLAVTGGFAHPDFHPAGCVSSGRGLRLTRTDDRPGAAVSTELEVVPRDAGPHLLYVQWLSADEASPATLKLSLGNSQGDLELSSNATSAPCSRQAIGPIDLTGPTRLRLGSSARSVTLDYVELARAATKMR